jgi:hypothetical protein
MRQEGCGQYFVVFSRKKNTSLLWKREQRALWRPIRFLSSFLSQDTGYPFRSVLVSRWPRVDLPGGGLFSCWLAGFFVIIIA